jgi:hypothetical protein
MDGIAREGSQRIMEETASRPGELSATAPLKEGVLCGLCFKSLFLAFLHQLW